MSNKPRIAVIGAGAIGSLVGGLLAKDGEDITLIGSESHIKAIQKNGLIIDGILGELRINVKATEKLDFSPDLVFISTKTQDVEKACTEIEPFIKDIPVVMMQNGVISTEIAAKTFGKENIIGCILLLNARFINPGRVTYVTERSIVIGKAFGGNGARIEEIQSLLNSVAETIISSNIRGAQWTKLFINSMGNALDAMTGLSLGGYIKYPGMRKIGIQILKEALRTVEKGNIRLESLPGIPVSGFKLIIKAPVPIAAFILKYTMSPKGYANIETSTLQSLRKGKKTEIDYLNGEFVRLSKRLGIPAPYNAKVVELIHKIENTRTFYSSEELVSIFSALQSSTTPISSV